jgi:hypothetical protein
MPVSPRKPVPPFRHHKASGQALVKLGASEAYRNL